jgi:hypothetical protein
MVVRIMELRATPETLFWSKVDATGDCWNWTGARQKQGYGNVNYRGRFWRAHRLAYSLLVGDIPDGLQLDHLCLNKACVNPDHLEVVTHAENLRRVKFNAGGAFQRAKTHCPYGHAYTPDNIYRATKQGGRSCKACKKLRNSGLDPRGLDWGRDARIS